MTLEEVSNPENKKFEFEQQVNDTESKTLQSKIKEDKPVEDVVPTEKIPDVKEDIEVQKQIPITFLSDEDDKCLFDDDKFPVTCEARVSSDQKLYTHCDEKALSKRKKMKVVEFASITHQGKTLNMLGEIAVVWRPKTRPKNKLRLIEDLECAKTIGIMLCFSCFGLLKLNADHELMEMNFRKKKKDLFVHKIPIHKNLSQFFNSYQFLKDSL